MDEEETGQTLDLPLELMDSCAIGIQTIDLNSVVYYIKNLIYLTY